MIIEPPGPYMKWIKIALIAVFVVVMAVNGWYCYTSWSKMNRRDKQEAVGPKNPVEVARREAFDQHLTKEINPQ